MYINYYSVKQVIWQRLPGLFSAELFLLDPFLLELFLPGPPVLGPFSSGKHFV